MIKLKHRKNGVIYEIEMTKTPPTGRRFVFRHNGENWYIPLVAQDSPNASHFKIFHNGEIFALSKGHNIANMLTYNDERTVVTLNGTDQVAKDSTKEIFSGNLLKTDYDSSVVTIVAAVGANNGELFTIQGNDNNNFIRNCANNAFIIGGASNNTLSISGDNATVAGGTGNDLIDFSGNGVVVFNTGDGSDTINYSTNYKIDFGGESGYTTTVEGSDVIVYKDSDSIRVTNALGKEIKVLNYNGDADTVITSTRDIDNMLTYNDVKKVVTLNGSAQATLAGKKLFEGNLNSSDYLSSVITIVAAAGANNNKGIYIEGNTKNNMIIIEADGDHSINGATGNDRITLLSGGGNDVMVYSASQHNDTVWNFEAANDKVQLLNYNASDFKRDINSEGDVIFTLGSGLINLKNIANDEGVKITVIGSDGTEIDGVSGYTYAKTFIADKDKNVSLNVAVTQKGGYTLKASDKSVDASNITTPITIDASAVTGDVAITGVKETDKIGVAISAIKTSSFDSSNGITLGLNNGANLNIVAKTITNTINLTDGAFTVGTNYLYQDNANTLTSDFDTWFTAGSDSSTTIFGGFVTNNIGLSGAGGNDFITTGKGNDSVFGGGGSNTFVFGGGNDTIFDYVFGNDIINAGVIDINNGTYNETTGCVTISKDEKNSLTIFVGKTPAPNVTFTDGVNETIKNYTNIGFFNNNITAVTLKADVRITDDGSIGFVADKLVNEQGLTYANISTIVANNVCDTMSTKPIIKGLEGVSNYIFGGSKVMKLIGGNLADTLESGSGSATLTGGGGNNVFKLGTGAKLITDYTTGDKIFYDEFTIDNISSIATVISGTKLMFDDGSTLELSAVTGDTLVTFNGEDYFFRATNNYQEIITGQKDGITLLTEAVNIALATESDTTITGANRIIAKNGGTITADNAGDKTIGGGNGITLVGGDGVDTFLYKSGGFGLINALTVTLDGETPVQADKIIIEGREIFCNSVNYTNLTEIYITTGNGVLTVNLTGEGATDLDELTVTVNGSEQNLTLVKTPSNHFSNMANPAQSNQVTLYSNYGDFGVIGDSLGSGGNGPGSEYYSILQTVIATEPNSTIIGNKNNNLFHITSGKINVITSGIGNDTFIFHSGGGLIKDYGSGCVKTVDKKTLAGLPTATGYNRTDPSTYKEGVDILQVYGRIKNIAFENYGAPNSASNKNEKFEAYVIYTADMDGKDYVIKLDNIYKIVANYVSETYRVDAVVVKSIFENNCYDTRNGSLDKLGSAYSDLCSTIEDSPYKTLIEEFDAMIAT